MGLRFFITILGIWLLFIVIRNAYRKRLSAKSAAERQRPVVDMVQCKQCGTHLPRHEALCDSDDCFCSQEHLLEYKKDISH